MIPLPGRSRIGSIVVLVLGAAAAMLVARGLAVGATTRVTVEQLWASSDSYQDRRVETEGVVRVFAPRTSEEYYVLEQAGQYRVGLRGVPPERLRLLVGRTVEVEGIARFREEAGIAIEVERLTLVPR